MTPPTVSVLMTCYNRERYLAAAIDSVLAQTFSDFELVIVDDASTDGSLAIAHRYAAADPRVRVETNQRNLGDYPNRNHAATFVRAPYFKFHDSDDLMYPHCLATMLAPLQAAPRAGFALTSSKDWPGGPCPMMLTPRMSYQREFLGQGLMHGGPACALFRTEVFQRLGGLPEKGVHSDFAFWLQACREVSLLLVPGDLFWYRIHSGQEVQKPTLGDEYLATFRDGWDALARPDCPLEGGELLVARRNFLYLIAKSAARDLRSGNLGRAGRALLAAGPSPADWLRYLRRPRRDRLAGTPLDDRGDYLVPGWAAAPRPAGGLEGQR